MLICSRTLGQGYGQVTTVSCLIEMGRRCGVALGDRTSIVGGTRVNVHLRMKGAIGTHVLAMDCV